MQNTYKEKPKVVIFPARMSPHYFFSLFDEAHQPGRRVFFLLSMRQVEDIVKELPVCPVPFAPPHIEGIAEWRGHVVPVISLEEWLGMHPEEAVSPDSARLISLRTSGITRGRTLIRTGTEIRIMPVPVSSVPRPSEVRWAPDKECVKGVYEWAEGWLLVIA
jgi:chemotaxis signal transduction protein